jgi:MoaA/NifB/PqqE/SkfB family radical SAM enzyme/SAM-dependent methyltransferase
MNQIEKWQRLQFQNIPIYVRPDVPDWFVPNQAADAALELLQKTGQSNREIDYLLKRIEGPTGVSYQWLSELLNMDNLKDCWIHITNRCNLKCRHCLFKSSPRERDELSPEDCESIIHEAYNLGSRIFFFTGGEPLLAGAFDRSVQRILQLSDTHVVVLSNLSLLAGKKDFFLTFPKDRLHFQVGVDGLEANHDALRGIGAFRQLKSNLALLRELGFPVTLAMTVTRQNVDEMPGLIDFAADQKISNVHFLWLFQKGRADESLLVDPETIFHFLIAAQEQAEKAGVKIDNIEILRSQVFSCPGTKYDLSNAGWQSLAVGPDGQVYPTPALVYTESMRCGSIQSGLKKVWQESAVLQSVRDASLNHSDQYGTNPLRFIIGGGDIDHSYVHSGKIAANDPYAELYTSIVQWLITREASYSITDGYPAFRLRMGEKLGDCPAEGSDIFFTHSNCVLSLPGHDIHTQVNRFYSQAAVEVREDILNPVCYPEPMVAHIPEEMRYRSYGCGSPVPDAGIREGETVVDLGSGTGIECFIAAKMTGPRGQVIGIDMGDTMLALSEKAKKHVVKNLTYDNISFKKAFLESLPLENDSVDLVVSNCVLNLSPDKRRVFQEIFRVLKPGGRMVVSDITYDQYLPLEIKYNEKLRGECLGGALRYHDLFGLHNDIGFSQSSIVSGYPYRTVKEYDFYSITYHAVKPARHQQRVLFDFPDFKSLMEKVKTEPACSCFKAPQKPAPAGMPEDVPHKAGCLVCGAEIVYFDTHCEMSCHYCGQRLPANAACEKNHFVCDACHSADAVEIIRHVCLKSREPDAVALMQLIRSHPRFRIHGPEHHSLVPAVILTALRNAGNDITDEQIITGIQRGQTIAGGACAFLGACGAAVGVGIAASVLLASNPYDGDKRQTVQQATQKALADIASLNAPRCCQRDSWLALRAASRILIKETGKNLPFVHPIVCKQVSKNKECILDRCPLYPTAFKSEN